MRGQDMSHAVDTNASNAIGRRLGSEPIGVELHGDNQRQSFSRPTVGRLAD